MSFLKTTGICLCLIFTSLLSCAQRKAEIYISHGGNDANTGTIDKPMASLNGALERLPSMKGFQSITIFMRAGYYPLNKTVLIDSGMIAGTQLTIANYNKEKVIISGGVELDTKKFHVVTDTKMLKRLPQNARGKVYETDMDAQGVVDFGNRLPHGFSRETTAPLELFFNESPLVLSRWPNNDMVPIGTVSDRGSMPRSGEKENRGALFTYNFDRPSQWQPNDDIWLYGIFAHSYADDNVPVDTIDTAGRTIKLKQASFYGVFASDESKEGRTRGYYFYNIPEELDTAGEWWIDKVHHTLYLWPPSDIHSAHISVSTLETPLVVLYHAKDVLLRGLEFGYGRGLGIYATGTDGVSISDCRFMNFGTKAISTSDPVGAFTVPYKKKNVSADKSPNIHFKVSSCTIYNTGTGAITLGGGDRRNLVPAGNLVSGCDIYNYSRINRASPPAIVLQGAGNTVTHCFIHDASSAAIGYSGNNHEISYNHIMQVATDFSDIGAVYTGRDPSSTGNKIYGNFFDSILSHRNYAVAAVYMDDGSGGMIVSGNIFYKCGSSTGYGAIHVNGGSDNRFENNYFISCPKVISNTFWDDKKWHDYMSRPDMLKRLTKDVDIRSDKYLSEYPFLRSFFDSSGTQPPRLNFISNSLLYKVDRIVGGNNNFKVDNVYTSADGSEFVNIKEKNFDLRTIPPVLQKSKNWEPVPFDRIGPGK